MRLKLIAIIIAIAFLIVILIIALVLQNAYNNWTNEVIQTNRILCEVVVKQIDHSSQSVLDSLKKSRYFSEGYKSTLITNEVDKILVNITTKNLESAYGMEGGFYFLSSDQFQGYSYPTSPLPKPVYGPPPRSYNIIKQQITLSIKKDSLFVLMHQFDPAIFPLASLPIKIDGEIIGAAWARIHIERELPELQWTEILDITAFISIVGLILTMAITLRLKKRLDTIKNSLAKLETDPNHRLEFQPGIFGDISSYINKMVDTFQSEHERREFLERDLHQQDKMASLGKMIAGVAHEVKTPLAIIKTRIQMWQQKLKSSGSKNNSVKFFSDQSFQLVINEVNRLSNLVNRLLIFSKPVDQYFQNTNISSLINELLVLFQTQTYKEKAEINFENSSETLTVKIDPNKIEQVILNILTNSFDAIKSNGKILIRTGTENNFAFISIKDNGIGIPVDDQKNIFDPFFTTKGNGTGLGLSIAYEIIQAHNGKIEFTSEVDKGSTFIIYLPLSAKGTI